MLLIWMVSWHRVLKRILNETTADFLSSPTSVLYRLCLECICHYRDALVLNKLWLPVASIGGQRHDMTGVRDARAGALTHINYSNGSLPPENSVLLDLDEEFLLTIHLHNEEFLNLPYPGLALAPCIVVLIKQASRSFFPRPAIKWNRGCQG